MGNLQETNQDAASKIEAQVKVPLKQAIEFLCPFCPDAPLLILGVVDDPYGVSSYEDESILLAHPQPTCSEFATLGPEEFVSLAQEKAREKVAKA